MVIFCGDFNSNPDRDTYKFITNSIVNTGPTVKKSMYFLLSFNILFS